MKIAISVLLALFLIGCGDDNSKSSESMDAQTQEVKAAAQDTDTVADVPLEEDAVSDQADETVSDQAEEAVSSIKDASDKVVDAAKDTATDMADNAKDATDDMADSASDTVNSMTDAMTGMMPDNTSVSGKEIFKVCSTCHGMNAEKAALGKSQIIKGWDMIKIENALQGYKDGTYGGAMKAVMKGQASKLDSEEIEAVAEYISNL